MWWIALLIGCAPEPYTCPGAPGAATHLDAHELAVPVPGRVASGPWTPVLAPVERRDDGALVTVCVDGQDVRDPLALVRRRGAAWGSGWDLLAWLELVDLAPGEHELLVVSTRSGGRRVAARGSFVVERPGPRLDVEVVDETGAPVAARVVVTDGRQRVPVVEIPNRGDPPDRDRAIHSLFAPDGAASAWLPKGDYRLLAVRSVLDDVGVAEIELEEDTAVTLVVPRVVDDPYLVRADLHVHTGRSYDSFLPDRVRLDSLLGAGLDAVVLTDHNKVTDPGWLLGAAPAGSVLRGLPGVEHDLEAPPPHTDHGFDLGHLNAFPVVDEGAAPLPEQVVRRVGTTIGDFRRRQIEHPHPGSGSEVVVQLNHPRGIHFKPDRGVVRGAWPLFHALGFDHDAPVGEGANAWMTVPDPITGERGLDFDAIEVVNRFSWPLYQEVRADWFHLLDEGWFLTGTGNSDSHAAEVEVAGFPVNLVRAPRPDPELDTVAFVEALQAGRVGVSTGPVVDLEVVAGETRAGPGGLVAVPGEAVARVRVRAASWVPVDEVRLVVDGEVHTTWELRHEPGEVLDVLFEERVAFAGDGWILAEAGRPLDDGASQPTTGGDYGLIAPGYVPLGFTNPVRIDGDGDGRWDGVLEARRARPR